MPDPQADRVIDKLLAERQRAEEIGHREEVNVAVEQAEATVEKAPPALREEIREMFTEPEVMRLIRKHGKIPAEYLEEQVASKQREGI